MIIAVRQMRDARGLPRLRRRDLAMEVKPLSTATIIRAEAVDDEPPITAARAVAVQNTREAAAVAFAPENGGVAWRKRGA